MKILFIRINDKIGDSVIETFFYRELKRLFPQAHLSVMCCGNEAVLRGSPYIDHLILLPPAGLGKFAAAFGKIPFLRKEKYDLIISFTPHYRMKFFNAFLSARRKEPFDLIPGQHVSQAYVQVLKRLGGAAAPNTAYELALPPQARQAARQFLQAHQLAGVPFLLFNPQGGSPRRTLSVARVQAVLKELTGIPIVLLDYSGNYQSVNKAVLFSGRDILQTAALVEQAASVLTVDSAIAHVAEAFAKPMTVLFSLKNYDNEPQKDLSLLTVWGPRGAQVEKRWSPHCVDEIAPQEIAKTVLQQWAQKK